MIFLRDGAEQLKEKIKNYEWGCFFRIRALFWTFKTNYSCFFIWRINLKSCRGRRQNNIFFTRKFLLFFMVETKSPTSCRRSICPKKDAITCKKFLNKFVKILSTCIKIKNKKRLFWRKHRGRGSFSSAPQFKNNGRLLSFLNYFLMAYIFFHVF